MKILNKKLQNIRSDFIIFIQQRRKFNPVNSIDLERYFDLSGSEVRDLIRDLRREGYGIANTLIEKGKIRKIYFWAISWLEIKDTVYELEARAKDELYTCSQMRKRFNQFDNPKLDL